MPPIKPTAPGGVCVMAEEYGPEPGSFLPLPDSPSQQIALPWSMPGLHGTLASWVFPEGAVALHFDWHLVYKVYDPASGFPAQHEILAALCVQPPGQAASFPIARHYSPLLCDRGGGIPGSLLFAIPPGSVVGLWINGWSLGRGWPFSGNALEAQCRLFVKPGTPCQPFQMMPPAKLAALAEAPPALPKELAWWERRKPPAWALAAAKKERKRKPVAP